MSGEDETRHDASATPETPPAQAEGAARRTIDHIKLENFTAFRSLEMTFCPGINAFIGENSTGKTHLLKLVYYGCRRGGEVLPTPIMVEQSGVSGYSGVSGDEDVPRTPARLEDYFFCTFHDRWNLINFDADRPEASFTLKSGQDVFRRELNDLGRVEFGYRYSVGGPSAGFSGGEIPAVFIPAKEILSHNKHFLSTYEDRQIYFEKQYADILQASDRAPLRQIQPCIAAMMQRLERAIGGTVEQVEGVYHLNQNGRLLEFTLVAEGLRRLGLPWLLLRNGSIAPDCVLLWDEPESNLNPKLIGVAMQVLLELQRIGVQVFFATHSYIALEELNLRRLPEDLIMYHSLFRDKETNDIRCQSTEDFDLIEPNDILQAYADVLDRHVKRELGRGGDERSH
jgi:hypothetical protein